jgi:hypothetical protein
VASSVAAPIRGGGFGADAADDVSACCEVTSFGIDDVLLAVDPLTGGATLALIAISSPYERDRPGSSRLTDDAGPVAEGLGLGMGIAYPACEEDGSVSAAVEDLGLGIGIANVRAARAGLVAAGTCCVG